MLVKRLLDGFPHYVVVDVLDKTSIVVDYIEHSFPEATKTQLDGIESLVCAALGDMYNTYGLSPRDGEMN